MSWYHVASAVFGYLLAAMFSSYVSLTVSLTIWGNVWTWVILVFWWFVALWITWLIPVVIFGGGMLAIVGALSGLVGGLEAFENWKRRRRMNKGR